jgi:predicted peroxiredoxin
MKTFGVALLAAILGYVVGLFGTMAAIELFSSNQHDKSLEAAMTGVFVGGPLIAVMSMIVILALRRKRSSEE